MPKTEVVILQKIPRWEPKNSFTKVSAKLLLKAQLIYYTDNCSIKYPSILTRSKVMAAVAINALDSVKTVFETRSL